MAWLCRRHGKAHAHRRRWGLEAARGSKTVFIHIPKTAGSSLSESLGLPRPQPHFTLADAMVARRVPAETLIYVTRDPLDRLRSTFRYTRALARRRRKMRWGFAEAPFWWVAWYPSLEAFVQSPAFPVFVAHHFFFCPQAHYLAGVTQFRGDVKALRFDTVQEDAERLLGLSLPHLRRSPALPECELTLSPSAEARVRRAYADDYRFIAGSSN